VLRRIAFIVFAQRLVAPVEHVDGTNRRADADRAARLGPGPRYWVGDRPASIGA
jgi:hypothetical protein